VATSDATRAGVVALAGAPNVGKSTLLNRVLGQRLSIATAKPQTTRLRVLGVHSSGTVQIVFTDTPGIHVPHGLVHERMVGKARASIRGADLTCWLVSAKEGLTRIDRDEVPRLGEQPVLVVINKIDLVAREALLPLIAAIDALRPGVECVPVSALSGDNLDTLTRRLTEEMPEGPWLYGDDALTDQPTRVLVAELVREQIFEQIHREIPYHVAVMTETFEERGATTYIEASIYTDSASAKKILVGKDGQRIKSIGKAARKRIEELLGRPVYLQLHVRVKKDWQTDRKFLDEMGL
jgi:GTP-binding protein Era